ncbi:MAG: CHAD domain-containing protein [Bryobacteraceae bacterium]
MEAHIRASAAALLAKLAYQVALTSKRADPDTVHDLRVAIRRFSYCLRECSLFFAGKDVRKVRRRLRSLLELSAAVRDRDIALDLIKKSELKSTTQLTTALRKQREEAQENLKRRVRRWSERNFSKKWQTRLGL